MQTLNSDFIAAFDCDDTLVMWRDPKEGELTVDIPDSWGILKLVVNSDHVDKIKALRRSGYSIVVWSAGGHKWATSVVKALKLEEEVDLIMTKPMSYYDDMPAERWMEKQYVNFEKWTSKQ